MNVLSHESSQLIARTLGEAIVRMWSRLPQDVQHDLFEETMNSLDGSMRSKLAIFLHGKHSRTSGSSAARSMVEPDSLGG